MESLFQEVAGGSDLCEVDLPAKNWKQTVSTNLTGPDCTPSTGFDCNICLDFVQDPVVTLCGHLYCWPCIYKWLNLNNAASTEYSNQPEPHCPVCKSLISESTLVPLYGRGKTKKTSEEKSSNLDLVIPPRPPAPVSWHMIPTSPNQQRSAHHGNHFNQSQHQQLHHRNYLNQPQPYYYTSSPNSRFGRYNNYSTPTNSVHPVVGMFGDMVYERMFGNSMTDIYSYQNQNLNNPFTSYSSPRLRRQVMQADKSLTRICFFLFCCIILCLLLF